MKTQALLLSIVTITGLMWTLSLCLSHQYHVVYDRMTWTDAQQYCRDKFTDLATVHTQEDVDTLRRMVYVNRLEGQKEAWIGLYLNPNMGWRWSLADGRFYKDAEERTFRNWAWCRPIGSPDHLCAYMSHYDSRIPVGQWCDVPCERELRAICFNDTGPTKYIDMGPEKRTWAEARRECREKHTDLASVRNQEENQEIQKVMEDSNYWIGLHRDPRKWSDGSSSQEVRDNKYYWIGTYQDSWKWSDGSSSPFRDWRTGQPDGGREDMCVVQQFGNNSQWKDRRCSNTASFVCYGSTAKKQVLRVKLTVDSSLDVTGPAVPDAILEQLKQNMKENHQGAPADIKVRWLQQADGRIFHKEDKKKREKKKRERKAVLTKREL